MPIEPRLYQKYTGKMPGEAMNRMGESLAQSAAEKSNAAMRGPQTRFAAMRKWRMIIGVIGTLLVGAGLIWGLR